jgi:hypothetical protein
MLKISVRSNVKEFTRGLTRKQKTQVPFATARALTWTAQDVQKAIIEHIPRAFNVTKKWWLKQQPTGIKIRPANKTNLSARVYTNAHFARLQEEGGTKRPAKAANLLVPTSKVPKSRRKSGGAAVMLKQKKTFSTRKGIYRRKGPKKSSVVEMLFARTKTAHIQPRFGFKRTAIKTVRARFKRNFKRSLSKALDTAKQ